MFLVGDIGGTHTRFALVDRARQEWRLDQLRVFPSGADVGGMIRQYLLDTGKPPIETVACCGAGPLGADGRIRLTNAEVLLDPETLAQAAGTAHAILINDFAALARAVPELPPGSLSLLCGGPGRPEAPALVMGAGTGLGVAQLLPEHGGWAVIAGEGGHADLAPLDEEQLQAWRDLRAAHGRVSAETVLSGPGLERLYAVCIPGPALAAPDIAAAAWAGDPDAVKVLRLFTRWLGSFAGSLALVTGAQGGVFIAGGIIPSWGARFDRQVFHDAFTDKPPYTEWLREIPISVVTHPQPGLYGLAALAAERSGSLTSPP